MIFQRSCHITSMLVHCARLCWLLQAYGTAAMVKGPLTRKVGPLVSVAGCHVGFIDLIDPDRLYDYRTRLLTLRDALGQCLQNKRTCLVPMESPSWESHHVSDTQLLPIADGASAPAAPLTTVRPCAVCGHTPTCMRVFGARAVGPFIPASSL